jgi:rSAM/selenodomain-associated transferase 1
MKKALITFVKAPVPGTVKTRLQADIGAKKTVKIYKSFITEILSECALLKGVDKFLGCAPTTNNPFLNKLADKYEMQSFNQQGRNLGERIHNAFRECSRKGYSEIVLIGSDSPSMPIDFIKKGFFELNKSDLVIGPCFDQGLYLIGAKKVKIDKIFSNIKLDTGEDVNMILKKTNRKNISLSMLPFWYDVDTVYDLKFLKLHLKYLNKTLRL